MASNSSCNSSIFQDVPIAPAIEVFALTAQCNEDNSPKKVNLGVGAYRTEEGKPWVLPVVRTVETQIATDETLNHEYCPVAGTKSFRDAAVKILLGENSKAITQSRVESIQALGGTGAIRIAADFLKKILQYDCVYVSKPTWGNHKGIFKSAGFSQIKEYRYWKEDTRSLDLDGMLEDLRGAPEKSAVILHAVAHNPTGVDPTMEQWEQIAKVCKEKNIFVLMDIAYQGFATGDLEIDARAVRYFVDNEFEFFIAQSFSKNFGLYNERVGNLVIVANDSKAKTQALSQCEIIVRQTWSNPPNNGARIVSMVLNNPALCVEWKENLKTMADRIKLMRKLLYEKLRSLGTPGTWDHITSQTGMFCYTGLKPPQVDKLIKQHHIYLLKEGRINMCGLTQNNVEYVAQAIHDVVTASQKHDQHCK